MADGFAYFTSKDSGAPVLNAGAGRVIALLDWVLVSKGGWSKVLDGTANMAAYRATTGNRNYLRVDDRNATRTHLRGYQTMSAISTGTGAFPTTTATPLTDYGLIKGQDASSGAIEYFGVRTNRFLLLIVTERADAGFISSTIYAFGDILSRAVSDAHNTILMAYSYSWHGTQPYGLTGFDYTLPSTDDTLNGGYIRVNFPKNTTGSYNNPPASISYPYGPTSPNGTNTTTAAISTGLLSTDALIFSAHTAAAGTYLRSILPNFKILYEAVPVVPTTGFATYNGETFTVGGKSYRTFVEYRYSDNNTSKIRGFLLETSDTNPYLL